MPASPLSLRVTDAYRARLAALRLNALRRTGEGWREISIDLLERSYERWLETTTAALTVVQQQGARASDGYLAAFLTTELGVRAAPRGAADEYAGKSRDGRELAEALAPPLLTVKQRLAQDSDDAGAALRAGLARALRVVVLDTAWAPRQALTDLMASDDRVIGWRRVTSGNACGACLGAATGAIRKTDSVPDAHAHCRCTAEPVIRGVREHVARPTGADLFASKTPLEQDQLLGADKAELVRSGVITLPDLVAVSPMATEPGHITEAPLAALRP